MADNPYVNKVEYAGQTLIDVTDTTATEADVKEGKVFTLASGAKGTGSLKLGNTRIWVGTSDTAAATRDKAVTITGVTEYVTGDMFVITFTNAQDYNGGPRLNINGLGVKNIRRVSGSNAARYQWLAGETLAMVYNGTYMLLLNNGIASTTYYGLTKLTSTCTSTSSSLALTASGLNAYSERMIAGVPLYDAEATYAVGDKVRYSWYIYECNTAITEAEAWNEDHWTQLPAIQTQIDTINGKLSDITYNVVEPIDGYFTKRDAFRARIRNGSVVVESYINITTQIPANTEFASIAATGSYGGFIAINTSSRAVYYVSLRSTGRFSSETAIPTGYYYFVGCAI